MSGVADSGYIRAVTAAEVQAASGHGNAPARRPRGLGVGLAAGSGVPLRELCDWDEVPAAVAAARLREDPPELLVVDRSLDEAERNLLLEALPSAGDPARPALVVFSAAGRRGLEPPLEDAADDVVACDEAPEELLARVRTALRLRSVLSELARKKGEMERLYTRLETISRRMADELRLAAQVQRGLLPPPVHHPQLEIAREYIPVREIGGDFYDVVALGADRFAFAIGDVMGKGVPAALLAANLKACLRAQLVTGPEPIDDMVGRVNRLFWEISPKGLFSSLFFGLFDLQAMRLDYVNAGHDYPFVVRSQDGSTVDLVEGGTVLGLLEEARYQAASVPLQREDLVVFYSDGVTDRSDRNGELFGLERLRETARRARGDAARIALYTLLGEVQGFSAGTLPEDDMTLAVARLR
ncbi:MAG: PP2C family protein-serine/threonine phosphatase [Vicinamibacteria bacterium]|nr:PP2C family protein-serine/threonine phosphatase [Vicinamibacteria bacterium]